VAGNPLDDDLAARVADDARDDPERRVCRGEPWALLDVHLEEGIGEAAPLHACMAADAADLLAAEDHDSAAAGALDRLDRGDDSERPVELSALRDRVQVRARPDFRCAGCDLGSPEQVPGGIDLDLEPRLLQPAAREVVGLVLLG
jgi:hypothetical protein